MGDVRSELRDELLRRAHPAVAPKADERLPVALRAGVSEYG